MVVFIFLSTYWFCSSPTPTQIFSLLPPLQLSLLLYPIQYIDAAFLGCWLGWQLFYWATLTRNDPNSIAYIMLLVSWAKDSALSGLMWLLSNTSYNDLALSTWPEALKCRSKLSWVCWKRLIFWTRSTRSYQGLVIVTYLSCLVCQVNHRKTYLAGAWGKRETLWLKGTAD